MKRIYTFAAALLFLGACTSDGYTIRGNVEGLESPYVYLITFNGTHNVAARPKSKRAPSPSRARPNCPKWPI